MLASSCCYPVPGGGGGITCVLNNIVSICVLFKFSSSSSFGHRLMGHSKRLEVNYAQFLFIVSRSCNICFFALSLLASEQFKCDVFQP